MKKLVQAKDVPELQLLRAIAAAKPWAMMWDLAELPGMSDFPAKVVRAKLRQMINSGLVDGCPCGCRGDFEIKNKGQTRLAELVSATGNNPITPDQ